MTKSTKYLLVGQNPINWLTGIDFPATNLNLSFATVICYQLQYNNEKTAAI